MATTREEISIRLGVDSRAAISGIEQMQMKIAQFSTSAIKKLDGIFKANVFAAASTLVQQIIPTWQDIFNSVYKVNEEASKRLADQNSELRADARKVSDTRAQRDQALRDERVRNATLRERLEIAKRELKAEENNIEANRDKMEYLLRQKDELQAQLETIEKIAKETQLYNTGQPGGPVSGSTPAAEEAKAKIPGLVEQLNDLWHQIGATRAAGNTSAAKAAGLRGARDAATKELLKQYLERSDQNFFKSPERKPMPWQDDVSGKLSSWSARGSKWGQNVADKLSHWQKFGMKPAPKNEPPKPAPVDVRIVAVDTKAGGK